VKRWVALAVLAEPAAVAPVEMSAVDSACFVRSPAWAQP
jgi:hypothetical protein